MNNPIQNRDLEILDNYPMRKYLYIKVGGEAKRLVYPQNPKHLSLIHISEPTRPY